MVKTVIVEIERLDDKGFGIAKVGDSLLRIAYVLPGERVKILPKKTKKPIKPLSIISEAPNRTKPLCPYFGICGGCIWQHIKYNYQLELKQQRIEELFSPISSYINYIIKANRQWRYRNKMEFSFGGDRDNIQLGLKVLGRFDKVVNLDTCIIQGGKGDEILRIVRNFAYEKKLEPYDNVNHTGFLRFLVIRTSFNLGEIMVNLVTTTRGSIDLEALADKLKVNSLLWSVTDNLADVAVGQIQGVVGKDYITERLDNYFFRIYPYSFFQTNPLQAEKIFKLMRDVAGEGTIALDLYSGVGTIGLIVSENFEKVIGIEINKDAVSAAWVNAMINDVKNIEFIEGAVEKTLDKFLGTKIDVIFIDPPRPGLQRSVLKAINQILPKKIVYLSCNPKTQVRDIKYLIKEYKIDIVQPIDFFPQTPHIENLVVLSKK